MLNKLFYLVLFICGSAEIIYANDFKIAPNLVLPEGDHFYNVSVASGTDQGFLVTWINTYLIGSTVYFDNYACRLTKTGEMIDESAIFVGESYWPYYCPSAVSVGGNWILAFNQGGLYEYVGSIRLTPDGEVLDDPPVNVCNSIEQATLLYPILATNGQRILCVMEAAGSGLFGSIFDAELNVLVDRFLIFGQNIAQDFKPRVVTVGDKFFIAFLHDDPFGEGQVIKLMIVNSNGQILTSKTVSNDLDFHDGLPTITALNDTIYVTYFENGELRLRRYSADGDPFDANAITIANSPNYFSFLSDNLALYPTGYTDLVWANESFCHFWPIPSEPGITMLTFTSNLATHTFTPLQSQCQIQMESPSEFLWDSYSVIRAASIGNTVLTAWIDGRDGASRVYGNLLNTSVSIDVEETTPAVPTKFALKQNYPNPFNPRTTIEFDIPKTSDVTLKIFNILGKEVATLVSDRITAGSYSYDWDASNLASGVYLYRLEVGAFIETKNMILMR